MASWENFEKVLISDFEDIQGGTTPEGIHLGAMAGSLDLVQRGILGMEVGEEALWFNPIHYYPLNRISFKIKYRDAWILVKVQDKKLSIQLEEGISGSIRVGFGQIVYELGHGETLEFSAGNSSIGKENNHD